MTEQSAGSGDHSLVFSTFVLLHTVFKNSETGMCKED